MTKLKGTKTERNLLAAFAGESQARNRYDYFAKQAGKEGYVQISEIFAKTADQERVHAKTFFKLLEGGDVEITEKFPAGVIGTTLENLLAAAAGEHFENSTLYPEFARIANEEGFGKIAKTFENIAIAEKHHEARYRALAANISDGKVFKKDEKVIWTCSHCGYTHEGKEAPKACPACAHPQAYYEIKAENW